MKNAKEKILIVDDNQDIRKQLKWGLGGEDYELIMAGNAEEAMKQYVKQQPKVVLLDLGLPPAEDGATEGLRCLSDMLQHSMQAKIIIITGNEERENALKAVEAGAYDFYHKPIDLAELRVIINRALHLSELERENKRLQNRIEASEQFGIVGECNEIQEILRTIRKVATTDVPVLILGESGTGKELIARAIHAQSKRKDGPIVPVNCGAIPENLLESEFFGHEKGAFTGANNRRRGMVEYADGGTLFLDEIGELPPNLQVKILRFLQDSSFQRVGGREDISVDIRIIAATNINIEKALSSGDFREDLYYRISLVTIEVPPLRNRGDDILLLANFFLKKSSNESGITGSKFSPAALQAIRAYEWPGNVRELENKIRRATIMASSKSIQPDDLNLDKRTAAQNGDIPENLTLREARERTEKDMIHKVLRKHNGNISKASDELGVSRPTMYDLIKKHGIET